MKILLQTNNRKESQLAHEFKKLNESGFEVIPFGYIINPPKHVEGMFGSLPPTITLTGLEGITDQDKIITRSCIPLTKQLKCYKLKTNLDHVSHFNKTIQYNISHFDIRNIPDSDLFLNKKKDHWDVTALVNILDRSYKTSIFVKPLNDLKLFSGCLINPGQTLRQVLTDKNEIQNLSNYLEQVLISNNCPQIVEEFRCYVVNKEVITISRYRSGDSTDFESAMTFDNNYTIQIKEFAQHVIKNVYSPCDNFTIDIATLNTGELKVIEYNCLTTSGLYEANTKDLFNALKGYYYD